MVFALAVGECGERLSLKFGNLCGCKHRDSLLLRHTFFVLGGEKVCFFHHGHALHGVLLDEVLLREVTEVFVEEDMHLLHRGVGVTLIHPMIEDGFQIRRCYVSNNLVPDEREHLVLGGTFQPVVCGALHRWEFENLQPASEAVLQCFLRFVRVTHLSVELGDVVGDLLLGFGLGLAGEHFAAFYSLLVKIPDHALPAAIGSAKDVAVGG